MPSLTIKGKPGETGRFYFSSDLITIGRDTRDAADRPDLLLPDISRKISRYHAAVIRDKKGFYFLRDLGSANGTFVNGQLVYGRRLHEMDAIGVGELVLFYSEREERNIDLSHAIVVVEAGPDRRRKAGITTLLQDVPPNLIGRLSEHARQALHDVMHRLKSLPGQADRNSELLACLNPAIRAQQGVIVGIEMPFAVRPLAIHGLNIASGERFEISTEYIQQTLSAAVSGRALCFAEASVLCCPLRISADRIGIIYLKSRRSEGFSEDDRLFVEMLCGHLAPMTLPTPPSDTGRNSQGDSPERFSWQADMVAKSPQMRQVLSEIEACAGNSGSVLLCGEMGTGKEVAARAIHLRSSRASRPFIPVELSNLEKEFVSSTLFGWDKGSFTGAVSRTSGAFEQADGGTIFLDEIGDVGIDVQSKLRRAVEEKEVCHINSPTTIKVDVKIVAATNVNLDRAVNEGAFRGDLLQRFGSRITLPPLRERRMDIPLLMAYFIDQMPLPLRAVSHGATRLMLAYDWPGNVRELRETVKEFAAKGKEIIFSFDLPDRIQRGTETDDKANLRTIQEIEKQEIIRVLGIVDWNISGAWRILGYRSKQTLYNKLTKYEIKRPDSAPTSGH